MLSLLLLVLLGCLPFIIVTVVLAGICCCSISFLVRGPSAWVLHIRCIIGWRIRLEARIAVSSWWVLVCISMASTLGRSFRFILWRSVVTYDCLRLVHLFIANTSFGLFRDFILAIVLAILVTLELELMLSLLLCLTASGLSCLHWASITRIVIVVCWDFVILGLFKKCILRQRLHQEHLFSLAFFVPPLSNLFLLLKSASYSFLCIIGGFFTLSLLHN